MEGPVTTSASDKARESRSRRCCMCGDLFAFDKVTNTSRGWMCLSDYYRTASDNEDPDE
jgi:hypothetical protein